MQSLFCKLDCRVTLPPWRDRSSQWQLLEVWSLPWDCRRANRHSRCEAWLPFSLSRFGVFFVLLKLNLVFESHPAHSCFDISFCQRNCQRDIKHIYTESILSCKKRPCGIKYYRHQRWNCSGKNGVGFIPCVVVCLPRRQGGHPHPRKGRCYGVNPLTGIKK